MKIGKRVSAITIETVPVVFGSKRLQALAQIGRLPPGAELQVFFEGVRRGVRAYALSARNPSRNDVHHEIEALHRAADRGEYEVVTDLLEGLSSAARDCLIERLGRPGWRGETLPDTASLRDPARQGRACEAVRRLCTVGGKSREGRRRPGGKRSRSTYQPLLCGPTPTRNFRRLEAELDLVLSLQDAFVRATGREPAWTAQHRSPGPFARMTKEVLCLAGAPGDAVGLINELHRRRLAMQRRAEKRQAPAAPLSTNDP
jgi:hypothetical protein